MGDILPKIENFLFDILGLALPGLILMIVLAFPYVYVDLSSLSSVQIEKSLILTLIIQVQSLAHSFWTTDRTVAVFVIIISAYVLGHLIKVISIILYDFFVLIFDKSLNKVVYSFYNLFKKPFINIINCLWSSKPITRNKILVYLGEFVSPIKNLLTKIFTFKSPNYMSDNEDLKKNIIDIINERLKLEYPNKWYSVYKFSIIMQSQENIKSRTNFFLAKYNLYRSLSIVFIFATVFYFILFYGTGEIFDTRSKQVNSVILVLSLLLWFTFHYKYKRYWTLCGNESLVSLFYFLNKKKLSE